ncbi:AAA family ATPase, partial [Bacillus toyonensis]|uniref:AAA family ATPase n=1 Tax=Bacillus toyonensis TaxID=155322 RepID=UPI003397D3B0
RLYLNNPQLSNIYTFLSKGYKGIEEGFTAKNVICVLERKMIFDSYSKSDIIKSLNLKLYKDKEKILLFKNDTSLNFFKSRLENKDDKWTTKAKYIIKFLESIILDLWFNAGGYEFNNNLEYIKNIDSIAFLNDDLESRINYLLQVLQVIFDALKSEQVIEQYIYNLNFIKDYVSFLISCNKKYFKSDRTMSVNLNWDYDEKIFNLLTLYDRYIDNEYQLFHFINIKFKNMSVGELELANGFANLNAAIQVATHNKQIDSVLLLLDEPDASFHPEWSRRYIYNICRFLNNNDFEREVKFQILITTHSPFIISDIPREHITCINVIEKPFGNLKREVKKADFGLMGNFYDIIKNDFFITSPIGEYAKTIFKEIVEKINDLEKKSKDEIDNLKGIISSIGDEMIRIKLQQLLNDKELELLPEEERIKGRIKELEMELKKLKNKQGWESND